jgi:hypothetical protein
MPIIGPAIDVPPSPADRFPDATIERPWLKASYDLGLDAASGRMLATTVKGDIREYTFEVAFDGGVPRPTVRACKAFNGSDIDREVTGLPQGTPEDLLDYARRIGVHLRDLALELAAMAA